MSAEMRQDHDLVLKQTLKNLRLHQLWPQKGDSPTKSFYFRYILSIIFSSPFWIGLLLHLIIVSKNKLDVDTSEDIAVLASLLGMHCVTGTYIRCQKQIAHLYRSLANFENFGKPDNYEKRCRRLNFGSKFFSYYAVLGMVTYISMKQIEKPNCVKANKEKNLNEICGLWTAFWAPFDTFGVFMIIKGASAITFSAYEIAEYIIMRIKHLNLSLTKVFDDSSKEHKREKLVYCIKYHHHIMSLENQFDICYKYLNGTYILTFGIINAVLVNQFLRDKNIGALVHASGWVISFYFSCHAGQSLISESAKIPVAAFSSQWYSAPISLQKDLMLLIFNSQRGLFLHAFPIGIMSYGVFIALLKTSYSYFAVLNQTD